MNLAQRARQMSEGFSPDISDLWKQVEARVMARAEAHGTELVDPFLQLTVKGVTQNYGLSSQQIKLLERKCHEEGLNVIHHDDPDPGHPGSRPYTSLTW